MAVSPAELLAAAADLTSKTEGIEAKARAAISRVYYAAYHDCLAWHAALSAPGTVPSDVRNQGVHVEFAAQLQNPASSLTDDQKRISRAKGVALRRLHGDRVDADYRLRKNISAHDARTVLAAARRLITAV